MKKTALLSTVLAISLAPAVGMSATSGKSFNDYSRYVDSWTFEQATQPLVDQDTNSSRTLDENAAFGHQQYRGIGW